LAYPPPVPIISELLGVPATDHHQLENWSRRLGADLLSQLVLIQEQGDQLTESELISTCVLLLVAGHGTTANLIGNGVLALLRHPDQLAALRIALPAFAHRIVDPQPDESSLTYRPHVNLRGPERMTVSFNQIID
jgi:cytochrome P450